MKISNFISYASLFVGYASALQRMFDEETTSPVNTIIGPQKDEWEHRIYDRDNFPDHALRLKSPKELGVDSVNQYSGYLDIGNDKHLFMWFFESRNDPHNDPVILWLNGGPGCSSLEGLFFELGPATLGADLQPKYNPYSWNSNASVIFLDQPVNTGMSYSSQSVKDTRTGAVDVNALLSLFFQRFPQYPSTDFHLAGESYAGHYIPAIAKEITTSESYGQFFRLNTILIGNGLIDDYHQTPTYVDMACGNGGADAILNRNQCNQMRNQIPAFQRLAQQCYNTLDRNTCNRAGVSSNQILQSYAASGMNIYDVRKRCDPTPDNLCYADLEYVGNYLNQPSVRSAIGSEVGQWASCNNTINSQFSGTGDYSKPFHTDIKDMLEAGYPVLIYAGDKDMICNWLGQVAWTNALEWSGKANFNAAQSHTWTAGGQNAGEAKSANGLTFLRVYEAGHMVPHDQPANSLDMINRWLKGDYEYK